MTPATAGFPALLQQFFQRRLLAERGASAHTIASYRDTFELLLRYAERQTGRTASALTLADLDAPLVFAFLDHLEHERGNTPRTRNLRLTAIRSFMRHASLRDPAALPIAQRVLAICPKRFDRPALDFLSRAEKRCSTHLTPPAGAATATPSCSPSSTTAAPASPSSSACASPTCSSTAAPRSTSTARDASSASSRSGRSTATKLRTWLRQIDQSPEAPVFPNRAGKPLTRSGVEQRLRVAVAKASARCPSLAARRISPHTLRHTTAMHLLQSGVDITVIALWLGHEDTAPPHLYIEADLAMKETALRRLDEPSLKPLRYTPPDRLLAFLEAL